MKGKIILFWRHESQYDDFFITKFDLFNVINIYRNKIILIFCWLLCVCPFDFKRLA